MANSATGAEEFFKVAGQPEPETVVIAGVGRGDEVAVIQRLMPAAQMIGVEPQEMYCEQLRGKFPGQLFEGYGLSFQPGEGTLFIGAGESQRSSLIPYEVELAEDKMQQIQLTTLTEIHHETEPWGDTLLWLDVEGWEVEVLKGASVDVMDDICWINVEVSFMPMRDGPRWTSINDFVETLGFLCAGCHSVQKGGRTCDLVYVRREKWQEIRQSSIEWATKRRQKLHLTTD